MQRLTSDRHEAPPVAAITTGSAHTENPNGVPAGRPRHADSTPQASDREARNTRMHSTRPRQTVSPRCSTSRHRATNSSRDTWRFPRGMASTARAVTSMHLIVTQHTDRLLPFDAALNGVAAADHCPVPVTTWSCSTLEPNWSPFSKLALSSVAQPCSRHHRQVSSGCHSGSSAAAKRQGVYPVQPASHRGGLIGQRGDPPA
jgi:hypothetical protein